MSKIKHLYGLFVMATACIPLFFLLLFNGKILFIRHEMKEQLEKKLLVTISINKEDIQWVKKGKEILINDRLFDIKSFRSAGNTCFITGLFDDDETALIKTIENNQKDENTTGKTSRIFVQLIQSLQTLFFESEDQNQSPSLKQTPLDLFNIEGLSQPFKDILTPPPQPSYPSMI